MSLAVDLGASFFSSRVVFYFTESREKFSFCVLLWIKRARRKLYTPETETPLIHRSLCNSPVTKTLQSFLSNNRYSRINECTSNLSFILDPVKMFGLVRLVYEFICSPFHLKLIVAVLFVLFSWQSRSHTLSTSLHLFIEGKDRFDGRYILYKENRMDKLSILTDYQDRYWAFPDNQSVIFLSACSNFAISCFIFLSSALMCHVSLFISSLCVISWTFSVFLCLVSLKFPRVCSLVSMSRLPVVFSWILICFPFVSWTFLSCVVSLFEGRILDCISFFSII